MKNVEEQTAKLLAIPKETWKVKLFHTFVIAPASLAIGYAIHKLDLLADFHVWKLNQDVILVLILLFAGYSAAGDVVRGIAGYAAAIYKDVRGK